MKRLNHLFCISMLCILLAACDNEFSVDNAKVALHVGETAVLNIKHASGSCVAEATDGTVVDAKVNEEGKLELFGKDEGETVVQLTDSKNKTIEIHVASQLELPNRSLWTLIENSYICRAYAEDIHVAGRIEDELENNLPFTYHGRCIFKDMKEEHIQPKEENTVPYQFEDGILTLCNEEGKQYRYTITQWTEDNMTLREEGLTEYYRSLYPDAGITQVTRTVTWKRYYPPVMKNQTFTSFSSPPPYSCFLNSVGDTPAFCLKNRAK